MSLMQCCCQEDRVRPLRFQVEAIWQGPAADAEDLQGSLFAGCFQVGLDCPARANRVEDESARCVNRVADIDGQHHEFEWRGAPPSRKPGVRLRWSVVVYRWRRRWSH